MSRRTQIYVLVGLLVVLGVVYLFNRGPAVVQPAGVVAAQGRFQPLDVPDPTLRLDLLERIHKQEYTGTHRNIFSAAPPPPPPSQLKRESRIAFQGPLPPPPPPPLVVPVTFFGEETDQDTGDRQAFFSNGDDVYVVPEGGVLLNRFRVVKIGNDTVELEEISSGRSTTLSLALPQTPQ